MSDPDIHHELTGQNGRYSLTLNGASAELTYQIGAPDLIIANRTYVDPAIRRGKVAQALVERLVADARDSGVKILPACSYISALLRQHPEWEDVFAGG